MKQKVSPQLLVFAVGVGLSLLSISLLATLLLKGQLPEAATKGLRLSRTVVSGSSTSELSLKVGMRLIQNGHVQAGKKIFEDLLVKEPKNASVLNNLAYLAADQGNLPGAHEYLKTALALDAKCAECLNNEGAILSREGKSTEAAALFEQAALLDSTYADPRLNLAVLFEEKGDWTSSLKWYREAQSLLTDPKLKELAATRAKWMAQITENSRSLAGESAP